jgi:hypothetical protein
MVSTTHRKIFSYKNMFFCEHLPKNRLPKNCQFGFIQVKTLLKNTKKFLLKKREL